MRVGLIAAILVGVGGVAFGQGGGSMAGTPEGVMAQPRVYAWGEMPVRKMANGGESRDSVKGRLASGEAVSVHESVMPAGMKANPQHVIQHSEIITVLEGTVAFEHGTAAEKVGAGGVIYVAMGTLHTLHNVGDGPAKYVVVAIGGDVR
ncbi:MAG: Cupin 2 conserved barrel domain protein [Acidobacteriaceae bacterium]|nr:Cupin 2 conserved barrel domain protein [Acidobacteriaceae bacterium]